MRHGRDGKLNKSAMPRNPFLLAQLGRLSESYLPVIPIWMQKPMLTIGSTLGWVLGYDPRFSQYTQASAQPVLLERPSGPHEFGTGGGFCPRSPGLPFAPAFLVRHLTDGTICPLPDAIRPFFPAGWVTEARRLVIFLRMRTLPAKRQLRGRGDDGFIERLPERAGDGATRLHTASR